MQVITSKDNELIKHICKLKEKKYRNRYCEYLIEGVKLIREAIDENVKIKSIVVSENALNSQLVEKYLKKDLADLNYTVVTDNIFKIISDVEAPQGVLAIIEKQVKGEKIDLSKKFILALDDIQDPGNLGTIIRTADSANLTQILVSKGTVDSYSPKVIRSTMGAIFRVNVIECEDLSSTLQELKKKDYKVVATSLKAKENIYDIDFQKSIAVIGNEANGVSKEILDLADELTIIPMIGKTESLNVSVATGIILYEYIRKEKCTNGGRK